MANKNQLIDSAGHDTNAAPATVMSMVGKLSMRQKKKIRHPWTQGMLMLLSSESETGGVKCFHLKSGRIVTRDRWTSLPIPEEVVEGLNKRSENDPPADRVSAAPDFYLKGRRINGNELDSEDERLLDNSDPESSSDSKSESSSDEAPEETVTEPVRTELDLQDDVLYDNNNVGILDLHREQDNDGVPVINYTYIEEHPRVGDRFAMMVHARRIVRLHGMAMRMTISKAREKHGV
jgi:hypothetical protein